VHDSGSGEQGRKLKLLPTGIVIVVLLSGAITGLAVVEAPLLAWSLVGVAAAAALLLAPPSLRVAAAVLAATCSRLLVATGLVSGFANFFHFPLVLGVGLIAAVESRRYSPARRSLGVGLIGLLIVALASWLINGGDVVRPLLDWLVFAEPLLIIFAIIAMPPEKTSLRLLRGLILAVPIAQVPLVVYQVLVLGRGDPVQGFFIGMGAGAHVAGAVSLLGSLVCIARARWKGNIGSIVTWVSCGAVLFLVAIVADAKQVVIAFLPALLLVVLFSTRRRVTWVMVAIPIFAILVFAVFTLYPPLQKVLDWAFINRGAQGKMGAVALIAGRLSTGWVHWLIGLGPGNSVSRVSVMALEGIVRHDSPVYLLGLRPSATTVELWNLTASSRLFASSSAWSFISSWLGLLGDLGIAGLGVYSWTVAMMWVNLRGWSGWEAPSARAALLMMILLAFFYSWLEEPGYTLMAALVIGLGSVGDREVSIPPAGARDVSPPARAGWK
jgi:hypothetical protein